MVVVCLFVCLFCMFVCLYVCFLNLFPFLLCFIFLFCSILLFFSNKTPFFPTHPSSLTETKFFRFFVGEEEACRSILIEAHIHFGHASLQASHFLAYPTPNSLSSIENGKAFFAGRFLYLYIYIYFYIYFYFFIFSPLCRKEE